MKAFLELREVVSWKHDVYRVVDRSPDVPAVRLCMLWGQIEAIDGVVYGGSGYLVRFWVRATAEGRWLGPVFAPTFDAALALLSVDQTYDETHRHFSCLPHDAEPIREGDLAALKVFPDDPSGDFKKDEPRIGSMKKGTKVTWTNGVDVTGGALPSGRGVTTGDENNGRILVAVEGESHRVVWCVVASLTPIED